MPKVPPMKYRDVVKKLRKLGFVFRRASGGSHEIWWHEEKRTTCVVPHHREIKPGTIRSIARQSNVTIEDFVTI